MTDLTVTTKDLFTIPGYSKRPGFCRGGARDWFRAHGLDWAAFVQSGIAAETLAATDDGLALALVEWARKRQGAEHGNG